MVLLWRQAPEHDWKADRLELSESPLAITIGGVELQLLSWGRGVARKFGLLTPPQVRAWVSGQPVHGHFAVVAHQDEILVGGERVCLSTESAPVVTTYVPQDEARRPKCPVCRTEFVAGQAIIVCPQCGRMHHYQDADGDRPEKKCWSYHPQCPCGQSTALDGSGVWRPDREEGDAS